MTTLLGRKRVINEIKSSNYNIRSFGERAAMNMPLQGSSADIIKIAMLRIFERMKKEGLRSKLILQVHDELVIDAYEDEAGQSRRIVAVRNGKCRSAECAARGGGASREKLV